MTAYDDAIGPMGAAFLATQRAQETSGLSAAELAALDLDKYSRLVHGQSAAQAALQAIAKQAEPVAAPRSGASVGVPSSSNSLASVAVSGFPTGMTEEEIFHQWRAQRVRGGEGIGLLNQPAQTFAEAARAKAGRNALVQSNVIGPAVPMSREQMVANMRAREAAQLDNRGAGRFMTPGNSYQG